GHSSPPGFWYDQDVYEWVLLIQGNAKLRFYDEDEVVNLNPGDYLLIGPHQKHRVEETASDMETIWLAIFFK
ncbi:MAG: cupin domain-containing protein, partial [Candidatus Kapaibacteriota bacterium]